MAKHGEFRDFIKTLRKHWRTDLPEVRLLEQSLGPTMPKASTFYAGWAQIVGMHVYVNFQHSSKAWQVGRFTVNVILSRREGVPEGQGGPAAQPTAGPTRKAATGSDRCSAARTSGGTSRTIARRSRQRRGGQQATMTTRQCCPKPSSMSLANYARLSARSAPMSAQDPAASAGA